jgi:hypothetical protein
MHRLLALGAVAMMLAACATKYSQEGFNGEVLAQAGSDAIPPNYRELVARYVLALRMDQRRLGTAMIATPYNKPDGILGRLTGTTVPVVCVSFTSTNIFGQESKNYLLIPSRTANPMNGRSTELRS